MAGNTSKNTAQTPTIGQQNADAYKSLIAASTGIGSPMYNPTTTTTTYLTQTSQPDIAALVNNTMQQLLGRNATADEIQKYGQELLAAEKSNTGGYLGQTTYAATGKRNVVSGTQTTTGVDPAAFLQSIISGTAEAKDYRAATTYIQAMMQANNEFRGAYSG